MLLSFLFFTLAEDFVILFITPSARRARYFYTADCSLSSRVECFGVDASLVETLPSDDLNERDQVI